MFSLKARILGSVSILAVIASAVFAGLYMKSQLDTTREALQRAQEVSLSLLEATETIKRQAEDLVKSIENSEAERRQRDQDIIEETDQCLDAPLPQRLLD